MITLDPRGIIFLAIVGGFFASLTAFSLSSHFIWASRVRRLLEQEGFSVRQMERRWLTKGPFPDMRPAGMEHHKEWLVRVVAVDREHRPRAGWVRWRRKWPWEAADTWAAHWDEGPWSGQWGDAPAARRRGLSTAVFMALVLPPSLAGMGMGVYLLVRGIQEQQQRNELAPQTVGASAPTSGVSVAAVYEIRCRGGDGAFQLQQLSGGPRSEAGGQVWVALMSLEFRASPLAAGPDAAGLIPGTCAWIDRPLNDLEPRSIRFEAPATHTTDVPHTIFPTPGLSPDADYLRDPAQYWSFFVFNTNQGFLQATSHRRWTPPEAPFPDRNTQPPAGAGGEIAQRFVCERSYTNFAWGYQHRGIFIDRDGGLFRFSASTSTLPRPARSSDLGEAEMEAKYGPGPTLVRTVPREELLAMFRLIAPAAKGEHSKRAESGTRDFGSITSACYLFDPAAGRYREVELDVKGDWEYRNLAPEAQKLAAWLESLEPRPGEQRGPS
jgi:hypothetical protein